MFCFLKRPLQSIVFLSLAAGVVVRLRTQSQRGRGGQSLYIQLYLGDASIAACQIIRETDGKAQPNWELGSRGKLMVEKEELFSDR